MTDPVNILAALHKARTLVRQYSVPVEVILEKMTNIAKGIGINAINECEDIVCLHPAGREGLIAAGLLE
ncbi:MAG: hypothetical protein KGZ70_00795 [Hydrogenophaga sp.]|uniref:hypothetical protein n=1 Tax=Hydrogenophaga sp. TaxID=1904254 RepID=UPI001BBF7181|nr:hypothetical protein [Hydrogenophaga sp.]MBS3910377.1 hypothetical protein [Hydrogenophaga sp.]MDO9146715.1 hypothetical protein [Hydrogenophaga sp.]MDO9604018.1 hypothetical protein [Hydrogenophaga sp.]MDP2165132.1 hypothetical protein [Hydrogenophaga sp.]MDP3476872.1 hypothetical protein [Hydrogenophaga sp.]